MRSNRHSALARSQPAAVIHVHRLAQAPEGEPAEWPRERRAQDLAAAGAIARGQLLPQRAPRLARRQMIPIGFIQYRAPTAGPVHLLRASTTYLAVPEPARSAANAREHARAAADDLLAAPAGATTAQRRQLVGQVAGSGSGSDSV